MNTYTFKDGAVLEIKQDPHPYNPREEFDHLCKMFCFHQRYMLGDKHDYRYQDFKGWNEFYKQLYKDYDPVVIKPLNLYDHSGITISTSRFSCPWDSGHVGFVLISAEDCIKEYGKRDGDAHSLAEKVLDGEVKEYDQYLRGDIWGFNFKHPAGPKCEACGLTPNPEEDSCWRFYGSNPNENGMADHIPSEYREELESLAG